MKPKYEISIWEDVPSEDGASFIEQKIIVIGSDTMTSESRAREPKLVNNINGTNKFTFNMYYSYIDTRTGKKIENPYIPYLVNERKIKVLWKKKWYDLLIKQIKEDQVNHVFTYTCEDAYITELSRTGFELEFSTELQNNIDTAPELIKKVLEGTDWSFDENSSDSIYQLTEEAVYETSTIQDFSAIIEPDSSGQKVSILSGKPILIFYSQAPDINNLKDTIQFYYSGTNSWQHDENEMLVTNGTSYHVDVIWELDVENNIATAKIGENTIFKIDFNKGLSTKYRAERYVDSIKTKYEPVLKRYVNEYSNGTIRGYQKTEYNDATAVVNLFTNPSNFANFSGWIVGEQQKEGTELKFELYPEFTNTIQGYDYEATSFLRLKGQSLYQNTGIQNNRAYIPNGFIKNDEYIFRLKVCSNTGKDLPSGEYQDIPVLFSIGNCFITGETHTYDETTHWITYNLKCNESCSYNDLLDLLIELKLTEDDKYYWIEEIQFYKKIIGEDSVIIEPGQLDIQSVAQVVWKYYDPETNKNVISEKDFVYSYTSIDPWDEAVPDMNGYLKYGTIEEDNSNRFNILQSIAEIFECWVRFDVGHDDRGNITYKNVYLKREAGQETGIGFVYGIDLKGIIRNIKSDKISTKTIVQDNDNEFGTNGFCSIARSEQNFTRSNVIYNFDYYIQHGLLDRATVYSDLYSHFNDGAGFYSQLHQLNTEYDSITDTLLNKKIELTRQTAEYTVYNQYLTSAEEENSNLEDSIMKLASTDNIKAAIDYARNHPKNTKIKSLIKDRSTILANITEYKDLTLKLEDSIDALQDLITNLQTRQSEIVTILRELNAVFFKKYARYIQEGTWTSEDYWNDTLYYLDAVQVAYTSSRPQISYEINVLRISDIDEYSSKVFNLGDISFVQDKEYFGYMEDKITPYKERVTLTEITSYFDTPDKDSIKVQNYKTQFDDLFQRITAAVQSLEFNEGKYARVSNIVNDDGTIKSSVIQNTFNENKELVYGAQNESANIDNTGITVTDITDASRMVRVTSGGVFVTNDGGETWKNAVRGDGISTDLLTAGHVDTEKITIYNDETPSFCWDAYGLNAYKSDSFGENDPYQFVRFDQYGIYGINSKNLEGGIEFKPTSEDEVFQEAKFGLTWNRFFMKASNSNVGDKRMVTITSDDGILVTDKDGYALFQCSPNFEKEDIAAQIGGWKVTKDSIESILQQEESQYISINAGGNIGCYGGAAHEYIDYVYSVQLKNNIPDELIERMSDGQKKPLTKNMTIYPFFGSVGQTKTTFSEGNQINSDYTDCNNIPEQGQLPLISSLIFAVEEEDTKENLQDITYRIKGTDDLKLIVKAECDDTPEEIGKIIKQIDPITGKEILSAVYTYTFNLSFYYPKENNNGKIEEVLLFTIPYEEVTENTPQKSHYVPSADTTWTINKDGTAVFHNIVADGGKIAGWFIDNEKIYQTTNGEIDGPIKTQLNSNGTATKDGFDYSIITDAINAAIANIGGVWMSGGLINGYSIAAIAQMANQALNDAAAAKQRADEAYDHLPQHHHSLAYARKQVSIGDLVVIDVDATTSDTGW